MKARGSTWILAIGGAVLAAALASFVALRLHERQDHAHAGTGGEPDFHQWLHEQLETTSSQSAQLRPFEEHFESERRRLRKELATTGARLASAIREGDRHNAEIDLSLNELNRVQSELQRVTLDHFFDMKDHLTPEQAKKLLEWTHASLVD